MARGRAPTASAGIAAIALLALAAIPALPGAHAQTPGYEVARSVITSGGGPISAGRFGFVGSIGQVATGVQAQGRYAFSAGYWPMALPTTTPAPTATPTATPSPTSTPTTTATATVTSTATTAAVGTPTGTATPTATETLIATLTAAATGTPSPTPTAGAPSSPTGTPTAGPTASASRTATATATPTPPAGPTATWTPGPTALPTQVEQRIALHQGWNWFSFAIAPAPLGLEPIPTAYFHDYWGRLVLDRADAPVGAVVEAFDPRGNLVGAFTVHTPGYYGYLRVYGEDTTANPPIPGLRTGEALAFKVNGYPVALDPVVQWQNNPTPAELNLAARSAVSVGNALASIGGKYDYVLGEVGTYAPPPASQFLNTLTTLEPGQGYFVRTTQSAELVLRGRRLPASTPLQMASGWHWVGYLPTAARNLPAALDSLAGKYDYVLGEAGTYSPTGLSFLNTLHTLEPGKGYLIRMTQAATLYCDPIPSGEATPAPAVSPSPTAIMAAPTATPTPTMAPSPTGLPTATAGPTATATPPVATTTATATSPAVATPPGTVTATPSPAPTMAASPTPTPMASPPGG